MARNQVVDQDVVAEVEAAVAETKKINLSELLATAKSKGSGKGVGSLARKVMVKHLVEHNEWPKADDVVKQVKAAIPDCEITVKSVAWYKNDLISDQSKFKKTLEVLGYEAI